MNDRLESINIFLTKITDYIITLYILSILIILPLYFTEGYRYIGLDKSNLFFWINKKTAVILFFPIIIISCFNLCKLIKSSSKIKIHPLNLFIFIYTSALILSFFFSDYRETAWIGAYEWNMGLFTQLSFILSYLIIAYFWKPKKWILWLGISASSIVFLLGYLDRFDINLIKMDLKSPLYLSTIGNINWYCGYAVSVFFLGSTYLWKKEWPKEKQSRNLFKKILLMAYTVLGYATLITQGSESGILTILVIFLIFFCLSVDNLSKMISFCEQLTLLSLSCLISFFFRFILGKHFSGFDSFTFNLITKGWFSPLFALMTIFLSLWIKGIAKGIAKRNSYYKAYAILFAKAMIFLCFALVFSFFILAIKNTISPGSIGIFSDYSLFTLSHSWGNSRAASWSAGIMSFMEQNFLHKLIGIGPDSMAAYMYTNGSRELRLLLTRNFGTGMLTNTHNEWLTVLVNTGIIGLIGYVGIILSSIIRLIHKGRHHTISYSCGFCLIAYTINNMLSFQQTLNGASIFVIMGIGTAFLKKNELLHQDIDSP